MAEIIIRVLGQGAKEVGDNLELLIKELLARLGYGSFIRNAYKTGAEIDLKASHRVTQTPLLAECKARGQASDTPAVKHFFAEWQKERGADPRLFGLMVSTSGFTGTAMQWHAELDASTKIQFSLVGPEQLLDHLVNVDLILPPNAIN